MHLQYKIYTISNINSNNNNNKLLLITQFNHKNNLTRGLIRFLNPQNLSHNKNLITQLSLIKIIFN
jgi:hypothetical protein